MIRCGVSTPQQLTLSGTDFPVPAVVLVTAPDATAPIQVTPVSNTSTVVVFAFVFAACGTYTIVVADATGECDECASLPLSFTPEPLPCPTLCEPQTLQLLREAILHKLGDDDGAIWSTSEVDDTIREGYRLLTTTHDVFWDQVFSENLPRGFSYTQPWELAQVLHFKGFDYGYANFTAEFERRALGDERKRYGPANHTSPFEATDGLLARAGASTAIPATAELSKKLTTLDRATWDGRGIDALEARTYSRMDARYEITAGEVFGFMWQKDGVRTFRKVRVPATPSDAATINGSWGLLRRPTDLSTDTVTGTWGVPRRIPGHHPIGPDLWGAPRRPFLEGKNVRIEHFRQGRALDFDASICELPTMYARYIEDYARSVCLSRPGPGFDRDLAAHCEQRWQRGLKRLERRLQIVDTEHVTVMGGEGRSGVRRPPRPQLPWAYGSRVR